MGTGRAVVGTARVDVDERKRLEMLAIQAERVRVSALLDGLIELLLAEQSEFYSSDLVDAWIACDDESCTDRRYGFSVVQRHLRAREEEGQLVGRFVPRVGGGGLGRRYYSWGSSGPSDGSSESS